MVFCASHSATRGPTPFTNFTSVSSCSTQLMIKHGLLNGRASYYSEVIDEVIEAVAALVIDLVEQAGIIRFDLRCAIGIEEHRQLRTRFSYLCGKLYAIGFGHVVINHDGINITDTEDKQAKSGGLHRQWSKAVHQKHSLGHFEE